MAALVAVGARNVLPTNEVIRLSPDRRLWLVETGTIDVFAVEKDDEGRLGRRHHLHSVTGPGLMAGMGQGVDAPADVEMLAVSRGASLVSLDPDILGSSPVSTTVQTPLAWLLDRWIEGLGLGLSRNFAQRSTQTAQLAANGKAAPEEGTVISGHKGVVWAYVTAGSGRYMGIDDMAAGGRAMIPLSPRPGWLRWRGWRSPAMAALDW